MNVGFIGLGKMGYAMARNLLKAGHAVTVYNRTRSRAEALQAEGATLAEIPSDACKSEAVITCLADDSAVEAVVFGKQGIANSLAPGSIHVSMSTISPAIIERLSKAHNEVGQRFVAAPVFGRPDAAAAARLLIVAAGEPQTIAKCQPLFDAMGQRTVTVGENPVAASFVKLIGNFLLVSAVESLGEAITLLRKSGTDAQACMDFLTDTLFAAPVYKNYAELMLQQQFEPGFKLALGLKDVRLALDAAASLDVPMPTADLLQARVLKGIEQGKGEKDLAALALVAAEEAGHGIP